MDDAGEEKELVGGAVDHRNWRGICIAILVIVVVLSLIVAAIVIVSPKHKHKEYGELFTFEDMMDPEFQPRKFKYHWIGGTDYVVYISREGSLIEFNAAANSSEWILSNETFHLDHDLFYVSPDRRYVLLPYSVEQIYRHSYIAFYKIFDRYASSSEGQFISFPNGDGEWSGRRLQFAGWSAAGHSLSFVSGNNLYYQADPRSHPYQITSSDPGSSIFNGIPDWLYEEEILNSNVAHWWSPDSSAICYAVFDDSHVPVYRFPFYGTGDQTYGSIREFAYPKAGSLLRHVNPHVHVFVTMLDSPEITRELRPPADLGTDIYLSNVVWQNVRYIMVTWLNRHQNTSIISICDTHTADCSLNLLETTNEGKGWVNLGRPLVVDEGSYLTILPEQDSHYGFWKHIAIVSTPVGGRGMRVFLTQGTWDVTELVGYDFYSRSVYFIGTGGDPRKRHLYRVGPIESPAMRLHTPECLSCHISRDCQYVRATFSSSARFYILECLGPGVPVYLLRNTIGDSSWVLEDNQLLRSRLAGKHLPQKEYIEIALDDETRMWAQMLLPPTLNKDHIFKYPTIIYTYGGPGSQEVTEKFSIGWPTYMTSQQNVVYVSIDGHGSGGRGDRWLHALHGRLGTLEIQDQLRGAKYLRDNLPFVDGERMSIWGWSYGGFMTLHALAEDRDDILRCGIAVAPVTDWRYYDTAYTERFMGLAKDNYKGYDLANISWKADRFLGKDLMLIHGTADDNVHFQHSAQFMKSLTEVGVDFRTQIYVDNNHALDGDGTGLHMRRAMTNFFTDICWQGAEPRLPSDSLQNR